MRWDSQPKSLGGSGPRIHGFFYFSVNYTFRYDPKRRALNKYLRKTIKIQRRLNVRASVTGFGLTELTPCKKPRVYCRLNHENKHRKSYRFDFLAHLRLYHLTPAP